MSSACRLNESIPSIMPFRSILRSRSSNDFNRPTRSWSCSSVTPLSTMLSDCIAPLPPTSRNGACARPRKPPSPG